MSLGIAVFESVVLVLLVYNQQFRKVFFWIAGVGVVLTGLVFGGVYLYRVREDRVKNVIKISGGETLKYVPSSDLTAGLVPVVYLGHRQKFAFVCGNFGERGQWPTVDAKGHTECQ